MKKYPLLSKINSFSTNTGVQKELFWYKHIPLIYMGLLWLIIAFVLPPSSFASQTETQSKSQNSPPLKSPKQKIQVLPLEELKSFVQVFEYIHNNYIQDVADSRLFKNAIRGLMQGLDPHSDYYDQADYLYLQTLTKGKIGGIGIEVSYQDRQLRVITPLDGSPAKKVGLQSGDTILTINDQSVSDMSFIEVSRHIHGKPGSTLKLSVNRSGELNPIDFNITRTLIDLNSVTMQLLNQNIGYMRIGEFNDQTRVEVERRLAKPHADKNKSSLAGLIIDLRNNPGGLLEESIDVADLFLSTGTIVHIKTRDPKLNESFYATDANDIIDASIPIIILINAGTASAAEIFAGALQDHGRAILLGEQSFGKASVQTILPLSNKGAIQLTTAYYYTPNEYSIQARGIIPDIKVKQRVHTGTVKNISPQQRELDLKGHLEPQENTDKNLSTATSDRLITNDYQLQQAVNLLRGIAIIKNQKTPQ